LGLSIVGVGLVKDVEHSEASS